jgi:uncharacterized protein (AIM24 family)
MQIGDRVIISEKKHPRYKHTGRLVGTRGKNAGETLFLVFMDGTGKVFTIPESMMTKTNKRWAEEDELESP